MQLPVRSTSPSLQVITNLTCAGSAGEIPDSQELIRAPAGPFFICHTQDDAQSKNTSTDFPLEHLELK